MFHDDVGMKSATTDEFAPGRKKQRENKKMVLIYWFCIIRRVRGIYKVAVTVIKLFEEQQLFKCTRCSALAG